MLIERFKSKPNTHKNQQTATSSGVRSALFPITMNEKKIYFYLDKSRNPRGPVSKNELKQLSTMGNVLYRREGEHGWMSFATNPPLDEQHTKKEHAAPSSQFLAPQSLTPIPPNACDPGVPSYKSSETYSPSCIKTSTVIEWVLAIIAGTIGLFWGAGLLFKSQTDLGKSAVPVVTQIIREHITGPGVPTCTSVAIGEKVRSKVYKATAFLSNGISLSIQIEDLGSHVYVTVDLRPLYIDQVDKALQLLNNNWPP